MHLREAKQCFTPCLTRSPSSWSHEVDVLYLQYQCCRVTILVLGQTQKFWSLNFFDKNRSFELQQKSSKKNSEQFDHSLDEKKAKCSYSNLSSWKYWKFELWTIPNITLSSKPEPRATSNLALGWRELIRAKCWHRSETSRAVELSQWLNPPLNQSSNHPKIEVLAKFVLIDVFFCPQCFLFTTIEINMLWHWCCGCTMKWIFFVLQQFLRQKGTKPPNFDRTCPAFCQKKNPKNHRELWSTKAAYYFFTKK